MSGDAHIDFETGCAAELTGPRAVGVHKYTEHETFRVWLFSYRIGDLGHVNRWHVGDSDPVDLLNHIRNGGMTVAFNAMFERTVWNALRAKYKLWHWPVLRAEQQRDPMAVAMTLNLPASLDNVAEILKVDQLKDTEGKALMMQMAKPKKLKGGHLHWTYLEDGAEAYFKAIDRLGDYCDQDIRAETAVDKKLGPLTPAEQRIWVLDQVINDRGIPIDLPSVMRAIDITEYAKKQANIRMSQLTGGYVNKYTEVGKIQQWITAQGVECNSFRKQDHDELLVMSDIYDKPVVAEVINLRRGAGKTSTAKFLKMMDCACADDRIRGQFQFHGATQTGRWAGRLVQPQNLVRMDWEHDQKMIEYALNILQAPLSTEAAYELLSVWDGDDKVLTTLSKCLRPMIVAEPDHKLYGGDFSNIEGRINAWLAGEDWKLAAFRAFDNGTGPDLYKLAYAKAFGVDVNTVGKGPQRQIGKVQELALGYQGGVGSYISMGANYNVEPYQMVEPVRRATPADQWEGALRDYKAAPDKRGLPMDQWAAIKIIVRGWRKAHPKIVQSWYDLEDAVISAVSAPGMYVPAYGGRVWYVSDGAFLYCRLPSGRPISYPQPFLRWEVQEQIKIEGTWRNSDEFFQYEVDELKRLGFEFRKRGKNVVYFYGVDPETKQWRMHNLYGGHLCENIVQATAADVQREAMLSVEYVGGYPIILHAHDEVLAHVPDGYGDKDDYVECMSVKPAWMDGLPIAVSGFVEDRYVK